MKKYELNEKIFDEVLKYTAANHVEETENQWPSEEELATRYTFSRTFEKKMQQLFAEQKRRAQISKTKRTAVKIAAAFLIFITASIVLVMNVDALRVRVLNFFSDRSENSTIFSIGNDKEAFPETQGLSLPAYLPSDYTMVSLEITDDYYLAIYKDSVGNEILLEKLSGGFVAGVDSEDAYTENIVVNGQPAKYFEKNNIGTLIYKYDESVYLLSASLIKDELVKIAESME